MGWWLWFCGSGLYILTTRIFYRMHGQQKGNLVGVTTISKFKWICEMVFFISLFPQMTLFSFYFWFIANWWSSLVLLHFSLEPPSSNPESTADQEPSFHGGLAFRKSLFLPAGWFKEGKGSCSECCKSSVPCSSYMLKERLWHP